MTHRVFPFSALLCLLIGLAPASARGAEEPRKPSAEAPKISLEEFEKRKAEPNAVVLDVRSREEFAAGHIPGSVNLPVAAGDFDERVKQLDKEKTYLVHCAVGVRSERACKKMSGVVPNIYNFAGGMKEWTKAGKPVEK